MQKVPPLRHGQEHHWVMLVTVTLGGHHLSFPHHPPLPLFSLFFIRIITNDKGWEDYLLTCLNDKVIRAEDTLPIHLDLCRGLLEDFGIDLPNLLQLQEGICKGAPTGECANSANILPCYIHINC